MGRTDIAKMLIKKGADVNAKIKSGIYASWTPLDLASSMGQTEIVKLLKEHGAEE